LFRVAVFFFAAYIAARLKFVALKESAGGDCLCAAVELSLQQPPGEQEFGIEDTGL
jgi:hypothetical protein